MIFWDSSAIVPLIVTEPHSSAVRDVLEGDPGLVAWWATSVECQSALARALRSRRSTATIDDGHRRLAALRETWNEVVPSEEVRHRASLLLLRHPLTAADALQLGAAMTWALGQPRGHRFLSLDARLAEAARGEGFDLVAP